MDTNTNKVQTYFIPRQPNLTPEGGERRIINIFSIVAAILFILAFAVSVGIFFYQRYLNTQITTKDAALLAQKASFQTDLISQLEGVNSRFKKVATILDHHAVASPIFDYLQNNTLQTVRFGEFKLTNDLGGMTKISLKGKGRALSSVALQGDQFRSGKFLGSMSLGNLSIDDQGFVGFDITSDISPDLVSYRSILSSDTSAQPTSVKNSAAPAVSSIGKIQPTISTGATLGSSAVAQSDSVKDAYFKVKGEFEKAVNLEQVVALTKQYGSAKAIRDMNQQLADVSSASAPEKMAAFVILHAFTPPRNAFKTVTAVVTGATAQLTIMTKDALTQGLVAMSKESGIWKVDHESWKRASEVCIGTCGRADEVCIGTCGRADEVCIGTCGRADSSE